MRLVAGIREARAPSQQAASEGTRGPWIPRDQTSRSAARSRAPKEAQSIGPGGTSPKGGGGRGRPKPTAFAGPMLTLARLTPPTYPTYKWRLDQTRGLDQTKKLDKTRRLDQTRKPLSLPLNSNMSSHARQNAAGSAQALEDSQGP